MLYTTTDKLTFVRMLWDGMSANDSTVNLTDQTRLIILAQASYESGFGRSAAARYWNFWNIVRASNDPRPSIPGKDIFNGRVFVQRFRAYGDLQEGITDYIVFFSTTAKYAAAWAALQAGNTELFVSECKKAGYFPGDEDIYRDALVMLVTKTLPNMLYPPPPPPPPTEPGT